MRQWRTGSLDPDRPIGHRWTLKERLERRLGPPTARGCREWKGSKIGQLGYGSIKVGDQPVGVHRAIWTLHNGPIPAGMMVLHTCDNPPCGEINHLFLGTGKSNSADMIAKGRGSSQNGRNRRKLTNDQVRTILERARGGESQTALAHEYGVHVSTVNSYVTRRRKRAALR